MKLLPLLWVLLFVIPFPTRSMAHPWSDPLTSLGILVSDTQPKKQFIPLSEKRVEHPWSKSNEPIIQRVGFSYLYNETHEQSSWVAYELTKKEVQSSLAIRSNKFLSDPLVFTGTATAADYAESGYDRGHLAPAADMRWSPIAMSESFYFSNISPQIPAFNRGIWKQLEDLVRNWAMENESVFIVTGPVLTPDLHKLPNSRVSIPELFFKVVLDTNSSHLNGIGFLLANKNNDSSLTSYVVTIDSVQKITGLDFFYLLPDSVEKQIESLVCIPCWSWNGISSKTNSSKQKPLNSTLVQCGGITKSGRGCSRTTSCPSGRCFQHGCK